MKSQRKNQKRIKKFGINLKIERHLFESLDQIDLICDSVRPAIEGEARSKGYVPVSNLKLMPFTDINKNAGADEYRIELSTVYVGKKKARKE